MEEKTLKRRLQKTLLVASKLKNRLVFEEEVNKELGRKNHKLKKQLEEYEKQYDALAKVIFKLDPFIVEMVGETSCQQDDKSTTTNQRKQSLKPSGKVDIKVEWQVLKSMVIKIPGRDEEESVDEEYPPLLPRSLALSPQRNTSITVPQAYELAAAVASSITSSISSIGRPRSYRKRDSLFLQVPELMASHSNVRRSTETLSPPDQTQVTHSLGGLFPPEKDPSRSSSPFLPQGGEESEPKEPTIAMPMTLNDAVLVAPPSPGSRYVPLFEHFLVVGASVEAAQELALQLHSFEGETISSRLKKTLGGFLNSPKILGVARSNSSGPGQLETLPRRLSEPVDAPSIANPDNSQGNAESNVVGSPPKAASQDIFSLSSLTGTRGDRSRTKSVDSVQPPEDGSAHSTSSSASTGRSLFSSMFGGGGGNASNNAVRTTSLSMSGGRTASGENIAVPEVPKTGRVSDFVFAGGSAISQMFTSRSTRQPSTATAPPSIANGVATVSNPSTTTSTSLSAGVSLSGVALMAASSDHGLSTDDDNSPSNSSCSSPDNQAIVNAVVGASVAEEEEVVGDQSQPSSSVKDEKEAVTPKEDSLQTSTTPSAQQLILQVDKRSGIATVPGEVLFHYPPEAAIPPREVCDFCLPLGGKLRRLSNSKDEDSSVKEIFFGQRHGKRNEHCFIYLLEDKTGAGEGEDEETGANVSKLYVICVAVPRFLKVAINSSSTTSSGGQTTGTTTSNASVGSATGPSSMDFESFVCFAFLTRFPLFDFFFQVIFDLIGSERLLHLESLSSPQPQGVSQLLQSYEYLPRGLFEDVLGRLLVLPPPRFGETLTFPVSKELKVVSYLRPAPTNKNDSLPEHFIRAADWCLPPFLLHLPPDLIVWTISLLLCEAKVLVVGQEVGMVSCAIMSLLLLLQPLDWVAPVIPLLTNKMLDFIESPVPILAGIVLDGDLNAKVLDVQKILHLAQQDHNDIITAVLDLTTKEIYMSSIHSSLLSTLSLPDADLLTTRLCAHSPLPVKIGNGLTIAFPARAAKHKGCYTLSMEQQRVAACMHEVIVSHMISLVELVDESYKTMQEEEEQQQQLPIKINLNTDLMSATLEAKTTTTTATTRTPSTPKGSKIAEEEEENGGKADETDNEVVEYRFGDIGYSTPATATATTGVDETDDIKNNGNPSPSPQPTNPEGLVDLYNKIIGEDGVTNGSSTTNSQGSNNTTMTTAMQKTSSLFSMGSSGSLSSNTMQIITLHRNLFAGADEEEFMKRFLKTQICSEYLNSDR
eukprot:gene658-713_t